MFALFLYIDGLKGRFQVLIHQAIGTEELQKAYEIKGLFRTHTQNFMSALTLDYQIPGCTKNNNSYYLYTQLCPLVQHYPSN